MHRATSRLAAGAIAVGIALAIGLVIWLGQPRSAIHTYAARGDVEGVRRELARGADVNLEFSYKQFDDLTPLCLAARSGSLECVKLLVESGADLWRMEFAGRTALGNAVNHPEILAYLIDQGAEVDPNFGQRKPLYWAAEAGALESIKLLLEAGAALEDEPKALLEDPERNAWGGYQRGQSPLAAAVREEQPEALRFLLDYAQRNQLDVSRGKGEALRSAARTGSIECANMLIDAGVDLDLLSSPLKMSALMMASSDGDTEMVSFLVENGADLSIADEHGWTALHWAVVSEELESVKTLLELGADPWITDALGQTPLDKARDPFGDKRPNRKIIRILEDAMGL